MMRGLTVFNLMIAISTTVANAASPNKNIEMAALINTAENVCDINYGDRLLHFVMLGAADLRVDLQTAAKLADRRQAQIVAHLNRSRSLDQFCRNARMGKL